MTVWSVLSRKWRPRKKPASSRGRLCVGGLWRKRGRSFSSVTQPSCLDTSPRCRAGVRQCSGVVSERSTYPLCVLLSRAYCAKKTWSTWTKTSREAFKAVGQTSSLQMTGEPVTSFSDFISNCATRWQLVAGTLQLLFSGQSPRCRRGKVLCKSNPKKYPGTATDASNKCFIFQ